MSNKKNILSLILVAVVLIICGCDFVDDCWQLRVVCLGEDELYDFVNEYVTKGSFCSVELPESYLEYTKINYILTNKERKRTAKNFNCDSFRYSISFEFDINNEKSRIVFTL